MKILKERSEIAIAINDHKMPVITIDLADADEYGLVSCNVCIETKFRDGTPHFIHSELRAFTDEDKFEFCSYGTCISSDFGYHKIAEMLEWRKAPIIKADEDVLIVVYDSKAKECFEPIVLHTDKKVDAFCSRPIKFVDTDYSTRSFKAKVYDTFGMRKGIDSANLEDKLELVDLMFAKFKCREISKKHDSYEIRMKEPYAYNGELYHSVDTIDEVVKIVREALEDEKPWKEHNRYTVSWED